MSPSIWQVIIVVAIVLILFGPKRLPELGKSIAETIKGFKKGMKDDEIDVTHSAKNEELHSTNAQPSGATTSEKTTEKS